MWVVFKIQDAKDEVYESHRLPKEVAMAYVARETKGWQSITTQRSENVIRFGDTLYVVDKALLVWKPRELCTVKKARHVHKGETQTALSSVRGPAFMSFWST